MAISGLLAEMLERNAEHQKTLQPKPDMPSMVAHAHGPEGGNGVFVITCSDPRLNPYSILGVDQQREMHAVMIRNAGGRAFDAVRSLAVLGRIGNPATIVVMHHSDCGMTHFRDGEIKNHWYGLYPDAGAEIEGIKRYGEITGSIEESIKEDVAYLHESHFIQPGTAIVGLKYDVWDGTLKEIVSTTR